MEKGPRSPAATGAAGPAWPPAPAEARRWRTLRFDEIWAGQELPPLDVDVTASLVVAGAMSSRDYQDVHHDHAAAVGVGAKDIFMNIHTTGGFVGRFVTDWAGAEAVITSVRIRLGVPNYAGDSMRLSGVVRSAELRDDQGIVEVDVRGTNSLGDHVTATVTLSLPAKERRA